jgi:hypothetical protein
MATCDRFVYRRCTTQTVPGLEDGPNERSTTHVHRTQGRLDEYYSRPPAETYGEECEADLAGSVPVECPLWCNGRQGHVQSLFHKRIPAEEGHLPRHRSQRGWPVGHRPVEQPAAPGNREAPESGVGLFLEGSGSRSSRASTRSRASVPTSRRRCDRLASGTQS